MAAMESSSSCGPQENSQPGPPRAQAPNPTGGICRSEFPTLRVSISLLSRLGGCREERTPDIVIVWPADWMKGKEKWLEITAGGAGELAVKAASRETVS